MTSMGDGVPYVATWSVESQVEDTRLTPDGRVVKGVSVGFVTGHGVHGTVFVSDDQFRPEVVRAAILAKVADVDAIARMTHEG